MQESISNTTEFLSNLSEDKMKINEIIVEGYKEATAEFSAVAGDIASVTKTINDYRTLVNKNQVKDQERNIDRWRKQGWQKFSDFVSKNITKPTTTQIKQKSVPGKSINLLENNKWLIVIPLDKNASCFHGKKSDWCTTKINQPDFESYFYDKSITLIYCLNKKTGGMWAIAAGEEVNSIECFTQTDVNIDVEMFKKQTGLDPVALRDMAFEKTHKSTVSSARQSYNDMIAIIQKWLSAGNTQPDPEIEKMLLLTKSDIFAYLKQVPTPNEKIQLAAVNQDGWAIAHIKNPSEQMKLAGLPSHLMDSVSLFLTKPVILATALNAPTEPSKKTKSSACAIRAPSVNLRLSTIISFIFIFYTLYYTYHSIYNDRSAALDWYALTKSNQFTSINIASLHTNIISCPDVIPAAILLSN